MSRSCIPILILVIAGCGRDEPATIHQAVPPLSPPLAASPAPEPAQDYAEARNSFTTKLVRHGPSPQPWEPMATPRGSEEFAYRSGDLALKGYVSPDPRDGRRHPAVLFLHGGFAFGEGDWEMAQPFRDVGYVTMIPLLRGENGLPGDFSLYYDEIEDVLAAAEYLAGLPYVDPRQIYVAGHSAGGTLAVLTAMASDRFQAAASFSGTMDQSDLQGSQPGLVAFDPSDPRESQLRSPLAFATSLKCPARLYFGTNEPWARDQTERTASLAKSRGLDVEVEVVDGDHFTSVPPAIARAIDFFRRVGERNP